MPAKKAVCAARVEQCPTDLIVKPMQPAGDHLWPLQTALLDAFPPSDRRVRKAAQLLTPALTDAGGAWADLGCGDGVFSAMLCTHLPRGSTIYAVDRDPHALAAMQRNVAAHCCGHTLTPLLADFTQPLTLPPLDGLLLANALHFCREAAKVLGQLVPLIQPGGRLVVIEYNTRHGNAAVPYPLDEHDFLRLAVGVGLPGARIVARAPSTFLGEMYTGVATQR